MERNIIGIDVGGTHIDGVVLKDLKVIKFLKEPYEKDTMTASIHTLIDKLTKDLDGKVDTMHLSTTLSTNTIAEKTGDKTSLILEPGPGRVYQFNHLDADIYTIDAYVNHQGVEIKPINKDDLEKIKSQLKHETLGVITKFSTRNQSHENEMKSYFKNSVQFITEGHTLSGKLNYPRRVETAYLNNYVYPTFLPFAREMMTRFKHVHILKADGGTMLLEDAITKPVETILSGPAASFMGMKALLDQTSDAYLFDIGGTTTDVFFIADGDVMFEPKGIQIGKHKTLVRSIYSISLPLGGDSSVTIEDDAISFGKREHFALGFGGTTLTLTDALIALDDMEAPQKEKSVEALKSIDTNVERLSMKIVDNFVENIKKEVEKALYHINQKPVYTIREVLEDKKVEPQMIQSIGGPAKALKRHFERHFKLPYQTPKEYAYANALGAALSRKTDVVSVLANTKRLSLSIPEKSYEQKIDHRFTVEDAIELAKTFLDDENVEIIEQESFNMVSYGMHSDKNIRVTLQIKPGLITDKEQE